MERKARDARCLPLRKITFAAMTTTHASCLFLIVARGGSRGVPGKNIRPIGGLSLVGWKARAAAAAAPGARLVISTDSAEIADEARRHGVDVPFMRPADLATDTATSASVVKHALETLATQGEHFTWVMLLEPSAPFATATHMREALNMMARLDADLVVGMKETHPHTAFIGERPDDESVALIIESMRRRGRHLRRQDLKQEWTMNGALYLFRADMFLRENDIYGGARSFGLIMDTHHSIEIDSPADLEFAQYVFDKGYVKLP